MKPMHFFSPSLEESHSDSQDIKEDSLFPTESQEQAPPSSAPRSKNQLQVNEKRSRRKACLRLVLCVSLLAAIGVCSTLSYILLKDSEDALADTTYESIAMAALSNAKSITERKLQGSHVMAEVLSQSLPRGSDWPLVDLPGYIPIATKVAQLSSSNTQSLMIFIQPDEAPAFQDHFQRVYQDEKRPLGTGYQDFGFGIWMSDRNDPPMFEDGRLPDISGTTDWGGKHQILAPLTLHNVPGAGSLLYNVYSDADRGIHLESMMECVAGSIREQSKHISDPTNMTSPTCPVITDMLVLKIRPGPAGLLFNPVYPAQDPTKLVGFATTSIHWQEVLEAVVPDYVSGLTCVVSTATSSFTYEIQNGEPQLVGDGDMHDQAYTDYGRSVILNELETGTTTSSVYTLTVYPTDEMNEPYKSNIPLFVSFGFAGVILFCALLFVLYDYLIRLEAKERNTFVDELMLENERQANDHMWNVKREELQFDDPPHILGQGTFGVVLLAQYRGTHVAVKCVIPPSEADAIHGISEMFDVYGNVEIDGTKSTMNALSALAVKSNPGSWGALGFDSHQKPMTSHNPKSSTVSPDEFTMMKDEFVEEMRHLSRLRHPCITTVMGAVICENEDPMLIMEYMDKGSLHDILHNETMALDGEILLPILRDISQGMRFLHSANPAVTHGDLKSSNILVDNRFRAKVADFFAQTKRRDRVATGTPFFMAPELLRQDSTNTRATDIFSFGVILYEVYSRKDPFHGEDAGEVLAAIRDPVICKRVKAPEGMPPQIKLLMDDCLQEDPEMRPSFEEIDLRLKRIDTEMATPSGNKKDRGQVSLFDIFPKHIAQALRDGRTVEPEHKEMVTIFFSDIVGFTQISATLEPRKVANMLDRLYSQLDSLTVVHDLYKIETIGDAFMAATNLVSHQPADHCKRVALFALEAIEVANRTLIDEDDPSKGCISIRIGFHTGPVTADVVGNRNPRYCLFGDTVNVAARMESHSSPNRINCSEHAADILMMQWPDLHLVDRGEISIKGKGMMRCFWVLDETADVGSFSREHSSAGTIPTIMISEEELEQEQEHEHVPVEPQIELEKPNEEFEHEFNGDEEELTDEMV